jgi:hypothetical protein
MEIANREVTRGQITAARQQKQWWTVGETADSKAKTADIEERLGGTEPVRTPPDPAGWLP